MQSSGVVDSEVEVPQRGCGWGRAGPLRVAVCVQRRRMREGSDCGRSQVGELKRKIRIQKVV